VVVLTAFGEGKLLMDTGGAVALPGGAIDVSVVCSIFFRYFFGPFAALFGVPSGKNKPAVKRRGTGASPYSDLRRKRDRQPGAMMYIVNCKSSGLAHI